MLYSVFLFLVVGCSDDKSKRIEQLNKDLIDINKSFAGKKFYLDNVEFKNDIVNAGKKQFEMIVFYYADCSNCIEDLKKWKKTIPNFQEVEKLVDIVFVLAGYVN